MGRVLKFEKPAPVPPAVGTCARCGVVIHLRSARNKPAYCCYQHAVAAKINPDPAWERQEGKTWFGRSEHWPPDINDD